ncbi:uncharacterized protein LOC122274655 [Carya illinoinensis]|uniref:uncharacterized protein LOC122274655 n=1 Tax=Carya illinoinensis TaxID=32201 RepID=UPI001C71F129|nr:uncharacterized protein LOC122274655 [Carya illinoinensis]
MLSWNPTPCGKWKLNFDGTVLYSLHHYEVGAILRNEKGDMIMAMARKEDEIYAVDDIDALVALQGLQMIYHIGISYLILEGDSLIIMEAIHSNEEQQFSYSLLLRKISILLSSFQSIDVQHVGKQDSATFRAECSSESHQPKPGYRILNSQLSDPAF